MGNLFTTLLNSTGTLSVYARAFNVIQNNISNANTPGYARQEQSILAMPFDPANGVSGGILPGPMLSARSQYLEQNVRNLQEHMGSAQQRSTDLSQIEPLFELTDNYGISGRLNKFFASFSQLSVNPNDSVARQSVIDLAGQVTQSFNNTAAGVNQINGNVSGQTVDAVAGVNHLTAEIARINSQYRASAQASNDAGLDAQLHAALEELGGLVNFTTVKTADGAANVYLNGQVPLVVGDRQYNIQEDLSGPQSVIRDSLGNDVTPQVTRGKLGALIEERNQTLPGYLAQLNQLAQSFADTVNTQLGTGIDKNGLTPTVNLFSYNSGADAAFTIGVTGITPDQIAAALPGAPGGNGNALLLSALADAPAVGGFTFTQFFGGLSAQIGRDVSSAQQERDQYRDAVTQAQAQRKDQTGVNLDAEAAKILQFQQAYQAVGKLVVVLNELTDSLMNMVH